MPAQSDSKVLKGLSGGAGLAAIGGVAGGILAILALVGVAPALLTSIAVIVLGAVLLFEGLSAGAEFGRWAGEHGRIAMAELGAGASMAVLGGVAAVVLGLLALLGIAPAVLLPISAIVIGGSIAMSAGVPARLSALRGGGIELGDFSRLAPGLGAGADVLAGISSAILGILALVGVATAILTEIALLASSVALLLSGFAAGGTTATALR